MQAWKGTYTSFEQNKAFLPVFVWFGWWVLSIFDMQLVSPDWSIEEYSSEEVVANEIAQNNETPQDAPNASTETQPEQIQQQPEQTTQVEQPQEAQTENPQN